MDEYARITRDLMKSFLALPLDTITLPAEELRELLNGYDTELYDAVEITEHLREAVIRVNNDKRQLEAQLIECDRIIAMLEIERDQMLAQAGA